MGYYYIANELYHYFFYSGIEIFIRNIYIKKL